MKCCVLNCKSDNRKEKGLCLFKFPKDQNLKRLWMQFCQLDKAIYKPNAHQVCIKHFNSEDILRNMQVELGLGSRRRLKKDAIPTVVVKDISPDKKARDERLRKRNNKKIVKALLEKPKVEQLAKSHVSDIEDVKTEPTVNVLTDMQNTDITMELQPFEELEYRLGQWISPANESKHDLELQVKNLVKENKFLKRKNSCLERRLWNQGMKYKYEIDRLKLKLAKTEHEKCTVEKNLQGMLSKGQLKQLNTRSKKPLSAEDNIANSITIYSAGSKGYNLLLS